MRVRFIRFVWWLSPPPSRSWPGPVAAQPRSNGKFKLVDVDANEGVFQCSKNNLFTLKGDYGKGITLADGGKSLKDLK